ncbi:MAG TPA: DUF3467 domain-containing protein [Candidatus Acidoferrales bacterium]|jgi:hypothetical protein|nr:DUF3467 domain-containing protein [Candidatus Acidoferrales bacterium]
MPEEPKITIQTKGIPSVFCNHAVTSISFGDIRVYLSEISPKEIIANPVGSEMTLKEPNIETKYCLVLTPEFAKSMANALNSAVGTYESVFGTLRPEPTIDQIPKALEKK